MKAKILVITDDKAFALSLARLLGKINYQIFHPEKDRVQQALFDEVPHLIVVDEAHDSAKGKQLALSLKQDVVLRYIPIILVVESRDTLLAKEIERIDDFFEKNKNLKPLTALVRRVLSKNSNELDVNPLTHLPGTRSSVSRMEQAIASKKKFSVLCVDLSDLAVFNKAYGDSRGDEVIIRTSEIVKKAIRLYGSSEDFIGHQGGDDFIVLTVPERAVAICEAVIQNFDSECAGFYDFEDRELGYLIQRNAEGELKRYPIMSLSAAVVDNRNIALKGVPQISHIAGELAKTMQTMPGSCYTLYQPPSKKSVKETPENSHEIHFPGKMKSVMIPGSTANPDQYIAFFYSILKDKQIQTLYQPLVDLKQKRVVGYEALTRPILYYPSNEATTLFGVARQTNHVKELDHLCVEFALKSAQALSRGLKLFLNLNHETLLDSDQMQDIFAQKGAIGFKNIVIEITEQSILRSFDKVSHALAELKEQGVSVAIDDMGGGAVSLRDVAMLKPDYIKFDRSLIRQIDASTTKQQILLSLILFAKGIGATTVAEGIETRQECETALMCGVHLGQGYYLARPGAPFPVASMEWGK